jgi:hypothetical protein
MDSGRDGPHDRTPPAARRRSRRSGRGRDRGCAARRTHRRRHFVRVPPFERADAAAAWIATAAEQKAFLLPHLPALTGISLGSIGVELRTQRNGTISADLDLRAAALGEERDFDAIRTVFPWVDVHSAAKVTLAGAAFAEDPRTLLSAVESVFARRDAGPYR